MACISTSPPRICLKIFVAILHFHLNRVISKGLQNGRMHFDSGMGSTVRVIRCICLEDQLMWKTSSPIPPPLCFLEVRPLWVSSGRDKLKVVRPHVPPAAHVDAHMPGQQPRLPFNHRQRGRLPACKSRGGGGQAPHDLLSHAWPCHGGSQWPISCLFYGGHPAKEEWRVRDSSSP